MPNKRGSAGRPTKEQAAALDDLILDGARASFAKNGISGTSIDEVSATLRVSKHTIYRRYRNKAALLEAVVERDMSLFKAELVAAKEKGAHPMDALREIAFRYVELGSSRDHATFYLSIMAEAARSAEMRRNLGRWSVTTLEPVRETIIEAQEANLMKERDPDLVCAIFIDLLEGANNTLRLGEDKSIALTNRDALVKQRWEVFCRLVV